ncbi:hypothetical protein FCM35_KLT17624 [Carex littledalei]|uniref:CCHC-type domain-containing protein n=1 Tax=Carex littledalei TaxID=544730 RepID=A0A833R906_9POAL|nr:hypothetical protein FCM35_KLT17624 [Carex littledalei]
MTEVRRNPGRFQRAEAFNSPTNNGAHLNGGWQQVTSKRNRRLREKTSQQPTKRFSAQVHPEFNRAIRENRCFRCLVTGHQRVQCKEPPKCFKCLKFRHYSSYCKQPIKASKVTTVPTKPKTHLRANSFQTYLDAVKGKPTMELIEEFWNARPEEEDVYLTSAHVLRPDTEFLGSATYVSLDRGQQSADLP